MNLRSFLCHWRHDHKDRNQYLNDLEFSFDEASVDLKRNFKFKEANYSCTSCGFNKLRDDGSSILQIDHIDGNHLNNDIDNLRVLCPNCHAMTPTYGPRNKKKGRLRLLRERKETQIRNSYKEDFVKLVLTIYESKKIDFSKKGWANKLAYLLHEDSRVTHRRVRKYLPEFYEQNCFRRGWRNELFADVTKMVKVPSR